ncbi:protein of unknown function [Methylotuvimicrobium alcaliphilum 20Z]|uniref:Uncharacterized protein n=1 Tax=Methylotuvimicrobium alcaliphilum (strain DSM 19304 / NCIMB 14124 / VKM B-2133 / 20Z) TaxID=1091494 RepID=G4SZJ2_META2|nr:protein of unknown function [Methylotuvimicrobium alcaliphilum 20Z]
MMFQAFHMLAEFSKRHQASGNLFVVSVDKFDFLVDVCDSAVSILAVSS